MTRLMTTDLFALAVTLQTIGVPARSVLGWQAGLRTDLVSSTRVGLVELLLREGDVAIDRA